MRIKGILPNKAIDEKIWHFALCSENFESDIQKLRNSWIEISSWPKEWRLVKQYAFFKDPDWILFEILEE